MMILMLNRRPICVDVPMAVAFMYMRFSLAAPLTANASIAAVAARTKVKYVLLKTYIFGSPYSSSSYIDGRLDSYDLGQKGTRHLAAASLDRRLPGSSFYLRWRLVTCDAFVL